tara:strand:+ start:1193 stop:1798 length:606 start_codon:yes stop_codon:yes gene_type:complete
MGYLEDYDKFVINRCNEEKKYYNTLMNNLSNGNLTPSPMGDGSFVITRPKIEEVKEEVLNARKSNKDSIDLGEDVEIDIKVQEDVIIPPIPVPPPPTPAPPTPAPPTPVRLSDAEIRALYRGDPNSRFPSKPSIQAKINTLPESQQGRIKGIMRAMRTEERNARNVAEALQRQADADAAALALSQAQTGLATPQAQPEPTK